MTRVVYDNPANKTGRVTNSRNRFVDDNLQGDLSAFHLGYINHIR